MDIGSQNIIKKGKILAFDDEGVFIHLYKSALEKANYAVFVTDDGNYALSLSDKEKYDFVITELETTGLSGEIFVRMIRASGMNVGTPLLICTRLKIKKVKRWFPLIPHLYYLQKPFDERALREKVKQILDIFRNKDTKSTKGKTGKIEIDVTFINPVLSATIHTLHAMAGINPNAERPYIKEMGVVTK